MKLAGKSLRRRLLLLLLGGYLGFSVLVVAMLYRHSHHEIDELFDEQLRQVAVNLLVLAEHWGPHERLPASPLPDDGKKRFRFQILDGAGEVRIRSPEAPLAPVAGSDGYTDHRNGEGHWRELLLTSDDGRHRAWVAENHGYRDQLVQQTIAHVLFPLLFGLPLLGIWVWVATGRGLIPLGLLTRQLETRGADQLSRLPEEQVPEEVQPLVNELNRLLAEVDHALTAERRFTAEAAHELRTPLAALHAQSQVALRARDAAERDHALEKLRLGLDRAVHLVEQMLVLARLDPERGLPGPEQLEQVDLGRLAEEVCADLGAAALAKPLEFDLEASPGVTLYGQRDWLWVLLRNLVDNAIRYTPAGGQVRVRVAGGSGQPGSFSVADSGPGIPDAARQEALSRFRRLDQTGQPGSGLGLSIVSRVVELHGASLNLGQAEEGGLRVEVVFPA